MNDPQSFPPPPESGGAPGEDARIEQLLVSGLDQYFAGEFEAAINLWTRVLFLDRQHNRARAYIERARSAQAERHRQGEALVHQGLDAFDRGAVDEARSLLREAMARGASHDLALGVLDRIDRLDVTGTRPSAPRPPRRPPVAHAAPGTARRRSAPILVAVLGLTLAVVTVLGAASWWAWTTNGWSGPWTRGAQAAPAAAFPETIGPLPVPAASEVYLSRGEALFASGRLTDALAQFTRVPEGDPLRPRADEMRARVQRELLTLALGESAAAGGRRVARTTAGMKCPKCGYLGFEATDRCRNCGYDFSLAAPPAGGELPLRTGGADMSLADLDLREATPAHRGPGRLEAFDTPDAPTAPSPPTPTDAFVFPDADREAAEELPLFAPRPAGQPLAVRRPGADVPRARRTTRHPRADTPSLPLIAEATAVDDPPARAMPGSAPAEVAGAGRRLAAALIDGVLLGGIDLAVVALTARIAGLEWSLDDLQAIRPLPMLAFFVVLAFLYMVGFTVGGGQTIGKMAMSVRVVGDTRRSVDLTGAVVRAVGALAAVATLGLLFVPVFFAADRRAVYDRLAGTRGGGRVNRLSLLVATFGYVGFFPIAPGTAGSAAALVLYALLRWVGAPAVDVALIGVVFAAGVWASTRTEIALGTVDPGPVVIDEVLGLLITLAGMPLSLTGVVVGFVLFRVFDVIKPWPARALEEAPAGWGIMLDDAAAGLYGQLVLRVLVWAWPAWMIA